MDGLHGGGTMPQEMMGESFLGYVFAEQLWVRHLISFPNVRSVVQDVKLQINKYLLSLQRLDLLLWV